LGEAHDGRLRSSRWRLLPVVAVAVIAFNAVLFALTPGVLTGLAAIIDNPFGLDALAGPGGMLTALGYIGLLGVVSASFTSVFLRFREARGTERQQLKWFAYASCILVLALFLNFLVQAVASVTLSRQVALLNSAQPTAKAAQVFLIGALSFVPVAVGIAIVRHRLYDIDLLINRTVVYGATTAAIAATFLRWHPRAHAGPKPDHSGRRACRRGIDSGELCPLPADPPTGAGHRRPALRPLPL
jgi:hypothetical protein